MLLRLTSYDDIRYRYKSGFTFRISSRPARLLFTTSSMRLFFAIAVAFGLCVSAEPISRPISFSSRKTLFTRRAEADAILASRSITDDAASFSNTSYDFLIVGAGTAGLALAARLSESGKYTVGVLEAGISGLGVPIIDIPGDFGADLGTIYDCKEFSLSPTRT